MKTYNNFNKLRCSSHRTWNMDESGFNSEIPSGQMMHLNSKRSLHKELVNHMHTSSSAGGPESETRKTQAAGKTHFYHFSSCIQQIYLSGTNVFQALYQALGIHQGTEDNNSCPRGINLSLFPSSKRATALQMP